MWSAAHQQEFGRTIAGHNVLAIFHGHRHPEEHYQWQGFQVFNVGSPKWYDLTYTVVRITATHLQVASWNWEEGRFT